MGNFYEKKVLGSRQERANAARFELGQSFKILAEDQVTQKEHDLLKKEFDLSLAATTFPHAANDFGVEIEKRKQRNAQIRSIALSLAVLLCFNLFLPTLLGPAVAAAFLTKLSYAALFIVGMWAFQNITSFIASRF